MFQRACIVLAATAALFAEDTSFVPVDHPAIRYFDGPVNDPAARLNQQLQSGKAKLEFRNDGFGYLRSMLERLGVNSDSQALVFSKTSFQAARISPRAPRSIYFNDDVTVGFVQGSDVLELAAYDPKQGYVFYTMENRKSDQPRIDRRDVCLQCHQGPATLGVPGIMVVSVFPDASGMANFRLGLPVTDHRTRFEERWGGWYVTGTHGGQRHRGNAVARDARFPDLLEIKGTQNLTDLARKFDTSTYLTPASDIVALMTLEHQTRMSNLITRVGWEARVAEHEGKTDDASRARLYADIESLVTYMLFADEAAWHEPIQGVSTYTKTFAQRGPKDSQGRSLRDFDLEKRLFRYPLSYMVYSAAFDALPDAARDRIYQRLYEVLTGKDQDKKFARLSEEERRSVVAILRETKANLPAYWR